MKVKLTWAQASKDHNGKTLEASTYAGSATEVYNNGFQRWLLLLYVHLEIMKVYFPPKQILPIIKKVSFTVKKKNS